MLRILLPHRLWLILIFFVSSWASAKQPNILLIMSDDQGYGDLGHHGNEQLETPTLDRLFEEGVVFENFYVSPVCAPTRASLLTGRYHHRTGTCGVFQGEEILRSEEITIPEALSEVGYVSGCFGKWHNGNHWPETPNAQGFDEFLGFTAGVLYDYYNPTLNYNGIEMPTEGYITDILTDAAIGFMAEVHASNKPFFCYVPYNVPHTPIQIDDPLFDKYKAMGLSDFDAGVYGMLENMDTNIARLLESLDSMNIAEDTIVIFLSDNGPNSKRYNGGLRGRKSSVHDGGVRVPFVMRWPAKLKASQSIKTLAAHIDILPTLAELTGAALDPAIELDGVDLSPLLRGEEFLFSQRLIYSFPYTRPAGKPLPGSVRNPQWSAVRHWDSDWALYNTQNDFGQKNDLAAEHPGVLRQLVTAYDRKFAEVTTRGLDAQPIQMGYAEEPVISLKAGNAFLDPTDEGGIEFSYQKFPLPGNYITNWTSPDAAAHWQIENHAAGRYRATIQYALTENGAGTQITLKSPAGTTSGTIEQAHTPTEKEIPFRLDFEAKKYRVFDWATADLGEIDLPNGQFDLVLASGENFIPGSLEVKALKLTPVD